MRVTLQHTAISEFELVLSGEFNLAPEGAGGRKSPISGGYRPTIKIGDDHIESQVRLEENRWVSPGESATGVLIVRARIWPDRVLPTFPSIRSGVHLDLHEGSRKIGEFMVHSVDQFDLHRL